MCVCVCLDNKVGSTCEKTTFRHQAAGVSHTQYQPLFIGLASVNNPYSGPETSSYPQKPDKPRDDVCIMVTEGEAVHP